MEYVDGEDLGSLLRRIGRLPVDKALEIARKLCAGLAAAHDKGVLHRDLKPSNIMIDGRGNVLITDFGLAGVAQQIQGADVRSGTPAYMAPEQLAGVEVSVLSDIYSLGLVLYELFSGKRAYEASTPAELQKLRELSTPTSLTTVVKDVDPAVERVILRCLQADPSKRPPSALAVSAALPGGDPLAAALAAGETPSPEMVAAAGAREGIRPGVAAACLTCAILALTMITYLGGRISILSKTPFEKSPDVLRSRAQEIVRALGYTEQPLDSAYELGYDQNYLRYLRQNDRMPNRWARLATGEPPVLLFSYRQSPHYLEAGNFVGHGIATGRVTTDDPPLTQPGMIRLTLDTKGGLRSFTAIPKEVEDSAPESRTPDWTLLFGLAGIDPAIFKPATPRWIPLTAFDSRAAWLSPASGTQWSSVRIEAAAWRGRLVYFEIVDPWSRPDRMQPVQYTRGERLRQVIMLILFLTALVGACLLAHRNLRLGRGDQNGAWRLAFLALGLTMLTWLFTASHVPNFHELVIFLMAVSWGLFEAAFLWLLYLALEPYVRKHWPQTLISWNRILAGEFKDPLVGRDLAIGTLWGLGLNLIGCLQTYLGLKLGFPPHQPRIELLSGPADLVTGMIDFIPDAAGASLLFFFLFFILRAVLRRQWLAGVIFVMIYTTTNYLQNPERWLVLPLGAIAFASVVVILIRVGLVAVVVGVLVNGLLYVAPFTPDPAAWYFWYGLTPMVAVLVLAAYAFHTARAGRPLFHGDLLDS
jgi:serine/threonine-protein kinase